MSHEQDNDEFAGGEAHDRTRSQCPHCDREWHSFAITEMITEVYRLDFDAVPCHCGAHDRTPVVCAASAYIGPMPAERPFRPVDLNAPTYVTVQQWFSAWLGLLKDYGRQTRPRMPAPPSLNRLWLKR